MSNKKPIDKDYLINSFKNFKINILDREYNKKATKRTIGNVKPDNKTIFIKDDGTIYTNEIKDIFDCGDVLGASISSNKNIVTLNWTDPDDLVVNDKTLATWAGTILVRKENSAPLDYEDGVIVINNTNHNAYSSNSFMEQIEYGKTYYYKFFTYTTDDVYFENGTCLSICPIRTIVDIPSYNGNLVYNGNEQIANFFNYQEEHFNVSGNTGINAGQYTATFTPKEDYCWSDGTSESRSVTWTIEKAEGFINIEQNDVTLNYDNKFVSINYYDPTGDVTVTSSNVDVVVAELADNKITVISPNEQNGTATITINISESNNYNAISININVMAVFMVIPTWSDATDEELAEVLEKAYAGEINLCDYWKVGDERKVELSAMPATGVNESHVAQTVTFVLMNVGGKMLAEQESDDGDIECQFIVGQKNLLANGTTAELGYMHSSYTYGWHNSKRRTWCNSVYYNSLPESFRAIFKKFKNINIEEQASSTLVTTEDYFAIPACIEITNTGDSGEGKLFTYYKTTANRIKRIGNTSTAANYWTRSPSSSLKCVRAIKTDGGTYAPETTTHRGIAPFGCI